MILQIDNITKDLPLDKMGALGVFIVLMIAMILFFAYKMCKKAK